MVIYDLICDLSHQFEGWFKNAQDLESQQSNGLLRCPVCDSPTVSKKVTAPKLYRKSNATTQLQVASEGAEAANKAKPSATNLKAKAAQYAKVQKMLRKVHEYVDANFDDVGNKFAEQALQMHRGEKELNNIKGTASSDELKELAEEGVPAIPLPAKPIDKKKLN